MKILFNIKQEVNTFWNGQSRFYMLINIRKGTFNIHILFL